MCRRFILPAITGILAGAPLWACPWEGSPFGAEIGPLPGNALAFHLEHFGRPGPAISRAVGGDPSAVGRWLTVRAWPVTAIHAALLPTGDVLHYSYPDPEYDGGSAAKVWNPSSDSFTDVTIDANLFCSGLSILEGGELLATGGSGEDECNGIPVGIPDAHLFEPQTFDWRPLADMSVARWYPTNVPLGDGDVLVLSGWDEQCDVTPVMEIFRPGQGFVTVPEGERQLALYPRLHLLPDGDVLHAGPERSAFRWNRQTLEWQWVDDMATGRWDGHTTLVPGTTAEVLSCGGSQGGSAPAAGCERLDMTAPTPAWRPTASMNIGRNHANSVILPDGSVLVVGGGLDGLYGSPVLNAEQYDPVAEHWTLLPAQAHGRMYHSTALLLPDGRVLSAGMDYGPSADSAEIYEPSYLFKGPRPTVDSTPPSAHYGESISVSSRDAKDIRDVVLLAATTVTHSVNNSQRYVALSHTVSASQLSITLPTNPNAAPPGSYLMFFVSHLGVPSVGRFLTLSNSPLFSDGFESGDVSAWSP